MLSGLRKLSQAGP
ncbi:unnamed protein product [Cuscuta europaea]|uniref:Uncharacterized protein n=1 Tax=Cuscuta europaea TaxID=41803 RepID=A0A9P1END5_CUSEU|nr:unnamed protein product [Cuscuta europaea]